MAILVALVYPPLTATFSYEYLVVTFNTKTKHFLRLAPWPVAADLWGLSV